jgi:hypothetical protein
MDRHGEERINGPLVACPCFSVAQGGCRGQCAGETISVALVR